MGGTATPPSATPASTGTPSTPPTNPPAAATPPANPHGDADALIGGKKDDATPPAAKPGEEPKPGDQATPVVYEITAPEGYEVSDDLKAQVTTVGNELGLTQDQVTKLVPLGEAIQKQNIAGWTKQVNDWKAATKADPKFGGANLGKTLDNANKVIERFAPGDDKAGVQEVLIGYGLGNHPAFARMMARIGAAMGEDTNPPGGGGQPAALTQQQVADRLFPNTAVQRQG